ncbi:MAG: chemotaxis protein CheC [Myxococcales bacterium]
MKHRPPITPLELSPQQIEALRQLANLGSSDAARSLGRLLGTSVEAAQPRAQVAPRGSVERVLQPDGAAFSVHFTVEGGARMRWMMHVTQEGAALMGGLLLGSPLFAAPDHGGFIYESALAEMSNIVVSSYVGGVAAAVGLTLVPSIPYVGKGLSETMEAAFGDLDSSLLLVTDLRLPGVRYAGRIVAAPVDESLSRLLSMLGVV